MNELERITVALWALSLWEDTMALSVQGTTGLPLSHARTHGLLLPRAGVISQSTPVSWACGGWGFCV